MRYTVQFAFDLRTLRLLDPSTYKPPAGAVLIPFELQENLPIVRAIFDAAAGPYRGQADGRYRREPVRRSEQTFRRRAPPDRGDERCHVERPAARLGGSAPFLHATGKRVTLGDFLERPRIGLSRAQSGSSSRSDRDGIIGNDLLRRLVATFDCRRRTLVLERPSQLRAKPQQRPWASPFGFVAVVVPSRPSCQTLDGSCLVDLE